jgi:hypothetical protein
MSGVFKKYFNYLFHTLYIHTKSITLVFPQSNLTHQQAYHNKPLQHF